jgi:hypothetical protein
MSPKALTLAEYQALATAIPKYFPNFAFLIASQTLTTAEVMTMVNTVLASATAITNAKSAVHTAVVAGEAVQAQYAATIKELREIIGVAYSNAPATLGEFAIAPRKARVPLTAAAKVAADAKAKATRAARGTTGKKKKAQITGGVTGVTIIPTTAAAPATAASASLQTIPAASMAPAPAAVSPGNAPAANGSAPHA